MNKSFYSNKKVFVTGHTGFKGSYLCKMLLMCGSTVEGYGLEPNTNPSLFNLMNLDKQMTSIIGDIRDYNKLYKEMKKFSPDIVIHLAAQPLVRESYINPRYTYDTNVMGTVNVLECIRNLTSVKSVVIITTDKVYKDKDSIYGYREIDELGGYDPYSNSKSCVELVYSGYYKSFFKDDDTISVSTARAGNVLGGGDFAKDRIMTDIVSNYLRGGDIVIRNPKAIRPYQYVLDALNGYLTLVEKQYENKSIEGAYNFGPKEELIIDNELLVNTFCKEVKNKIKWTTLENNNGPHESNILVLDSTKSKKVLGWSTKYNIELVIKKIIEWTNAYKNNKDINKVVEKQIDEFMRIK